ncbi:MAG: hypothetical protein OWU84_11985 [Firmicutes bacterium]|nr:hypothetical protein [Bacillota bacterium]
MAPSSNPSSQGGVSVPPAFVVSIAKSLAAKMGDPHPVSAQYVLTTRQRAEWFVARAHVHSNPEVYLVVLCGHFSDPFARVPPGAPTPTGTQIHFTIDPVTHGILDFGISHQSLGDLSVLGQVQPLVLS